MLLTLLQVVGNIGPRLGLESAHQVQFSFDLGIWSDLAFLSAIDQILEHSALNCERDDVA